MDPTLREFVCMANLLENHCTFFSCFLNTGTHFNWAFTAPVIVIILFNVGFFIMAAVALWRQRKSKKEGKMDRKDVASWLKVLVFLVLVMGLTWILGVLVLNVPALLPLAYIYTIMMAFQGLAIFLSLVAFQQPVRNEYIKWWKNKVQSPHEYLTKSSALNTKVFSKHNH